MSMIVEHSTQRIKNGMLYGLMKAGVHCVKGECVSHSLHPSQFAANGDLMAFTLDRCSLIHGQASRTNAVGQSCRALLNSAEANRVEEDSCSTMKNGQLNQHLGSGDSFRVSFGVAKLFQKGPHSPNHPRAVEEPHRLAVACRPRGKSPGDSAWACRGLPQTPPAATSALSQSAACSALAPRCVCLHHPWAGVSSSARLARVASLQAGRIAARPR